MELPQPTGDPWKPDINAPATVPIATQLVMSNITGQFRERERKLWTFLIHAVWDDLDKNVIHEIPVIKVSKLFREIGGDHNSKWLKEYLYSIAQTTMIFEGQNENHTVWRTTNLISSADIIKDKITGEEILSFEIPKKMVIMLKERYRFTRLRPHLMIALSGKYAVTLYELLESVANQKTPILKASISDLRKWLKVPTDKLLAWGNFFDRAIKPAVNELNQHSEESGFTVSYKIIKGIRGKVEEIHFTVTKVDSRTIFEEKIKRNVRKPIDLNSNIPSLKSITFEKASNILKESGIDKYYAESQWREWCLNKKQLPDNPDSAFLGFCRELVKNKTTTKKIDIFKWFK